MVIMEKPTRIWTITDAVWVVSLSDVHYLHIREENVKSGKYPCQLHSILENTLRII